MIEKDEKYKFIIPRLWMIVPICDQVRVCDGCSLGDGPSLRLWSLEMPSLESHSHYIVTLFSPVFSKEYLSSTKLI